MKNNLQKIVFILTLIFICFYADKAVFANNHEFDTFGGWTRIKGEETGFFHTQKINDRWWLITPEGNVFWSIGVYSVRMGGLPDLKTKQRTYKNNCLVKYKNEKTWAKEASRRLKEWGFNTIGDWSSQSVFINQPRLVYVESFGLPNASKNVIQSGKYGYFPDVFSKDFQIDVYNKIKEKFNTQPYLRDDPYLLGYFLGDEPTWFGSKGKRGSLTDDYIFLDKTNAGKIRWVNFLNDKYTNIDNLNNRWGTKFQSFSELLEIKFLKNEKNIKKDKLDFLKIIAEEFSKVLLNNLRKFDKNHMVLGSRPTRVYPEVLAGIGKYTDVFGISEYGLNKGYTIDKDFSKKIDKIYKFTNKPIILGILLPSKDTDLPFGIVNNQKDRGISYWRYLSKVASRPEIVGLHWFQYFDPPKHCYDKGASNWGLVNDKDVPYMEALTLMSKANEYIYFYAIRKLETVPNF